MNGLLRYLKTDHGPTDGQGRLLRTPSGEPGVQNEYEINRTYPLMVDCYTMWRSRQFGGSGGGLFFRGDILPITQNYSIPQRFQTPRLAQFSWHLTTLSQSPFYDLVGGEVAIETRFVFVTTKLPNLLLLLFVFMRGIFVGIFMVGILVSILVFIL